MGLEGEPVGGQLLAEGLQPSGSGCLGGIIADSACRHELRVGLRQGRNPFRQRARGRGPQQLRGLLRVSGDHSINIRAAGREKKPPRRAPGPAKHVPWWRRVETPHARKKISSSTSVLLSFPLSLWPRYEVIRRRRRRLIAFRAKCVSPHVCMDQVSVWCPGPGCLVLGLNHCLNLSWDTLRPA